MRIAIVGAGAITKLGHLPVALAEPQVKVTAIVDRDQARAAALAQAHGVPHVFTDYMDIVGKTDAAIVALPHNLHAPVSSALLRKGIHVLVEKPMAITTAECDDMLHAAEEGKAVLAVGHMRRFLASTKLVKNLITAGLLGEIRSVHVQEGFEYSWPTSTDFFFRKQFAGGGVLIDTGAHTLDCLQHWFGQLKLDTYRDDDSGGVEADCEVRLHVENGAPVSVDLSRTRRLRNTAVLEFEKVTLVVNLHDNTVRFQFSADDQSLAGEVDEHGQPQSAALVDLLAAQLRNWVEMIRAGGTPSESGVEAREVIRLIEQCYASRIPLLLPWMAIASKVASKPV